MRRDTEADQLWSHLYHTIAERDSFGALEAILARAEAQLLRLSMTYALLDCSRTIQVPHLLAAVALWDYAEASARYIFGKLRGSSVAERLYEGLCDSYPDGLDGKQQSRLFAGHARGAELDLARRQLEANRLIVTSSEESGGRPRLVSHALDPASKANEANEARQGLLPILLSHYSLPSPHITQRDPGSGSVGEDLGAWTSDLIEEDAL
jgi:hypothetical protein